MELNSEFIDAVNLLSFLIGILNYQENLTQNDKQEIIQEFNTKLNKVITQIEGHLKNQDQRLEQIEKILNERNFK